MGRAWVESFQQRSRSRRNHGQLVIRIGECLHGIQIVESHERDALHLAIVLAPMQGNSA